MITTNMWRKPKTCAKANVGKRFNRELFLIIALMKSLSIVNNMLETNYYTKRLNLSFRGQTFSS